MTGHKRLVSEGLSKSLLLTDPYSVSRPPFFHAAEPTYSYIVSSRDEATLYEGMSVGPSDGPSVRSVTSNLVVSLWLW